MAFVETGATVVLEAQLTDYGKKKLYESIEGGDVGSFITKFALGDSDTDYLAITNGVDPTTLENIPIPGDFKPSLRSFALYKGTYRPGPPRIFKDGNEDDLNVEFSIALNKENKMTFNLHTEWPAAEAFPEDYTVELIGPTSIEESRWNELFSYRLINNTDGQTLEVTFHGGLQLHELTYLMGNNADLGSDFYARIIGNQSNKYTNILFQITGNRE